MPKRQETDIFTVKKAIIQSFRTLLKDCSFEKISVQLITNHAGINRSTFYLHFADKYNLLEHITDELFTEFASYMPKMQISEPEQQAHSTSTITYKICNHFYVNRDFYNKQLNNADFIFELSTHYAKTLAIHIPNKSLADFISYGTIGYLMSWVKDSCVIPLESIVDGLEGIAKEAFIKPDY